MATRPATAEAAASACTQARTNTEHTGQQRAKSHLGRLGGRAAIAIVKKPVGKVANSESDGLRAAASASACPCALGLRGSGGADPSNELLGLLQIARLRAQPDA